MKKKMKKKAHERLSDTTKTLIMPFFCCCFPSVFYLSLTLFPNQFSLSFPLHPFMCYYDCSLLLPHLQQHQQQLPVLPPLPPP